YAYGSRHGLRESKFERLIDSTHEVNLHTVEHMRLQVLDDVRLVFRWQNHLADSGTLCSQDFFLNPADRQYHAGERKLTSHGYSRTNWPAREQANQRGNHRNACGRTVLRHRARGHVDVNVLLTEEVRIDVVALGIGSPPCERRSHRFLHHLAKMPGHGELLATPHAARLNKDDVSARGCPNQSNRNAGFLNALFDFAF